MRQIQGKNGEAIACDYLQAQGLQCLAKNYRQKIGEIDLIMQDKDVLVFVEVKLRKTRDYDLALESIDPYKQKRIINTALYYLQSKKLLDKVDCRFDVISIEDTPEQPRVEWISNAFDA